MTTNWDCVSEDQTRFSCGRCGEPVNAYRLREAGFRHVDCIRCGKDHTVSCWTTDDARFAYSITVLDSASQPDVRVIGYWPDEPKAKPKVDVKPRVTPTWIYFGCPVCDATLASDADRMVCTKTCTCGAELAVQRHRKDDAHCYVLWCKGQSWPLGTRALASEPKVESRTHARVYGEKIHVTCAHCDSTHEVEDPGSRVCRVACWVCSKAFTYERGDDGEIWVWTADPDEPRVVATVDIACPHCGETTPTADPGDGACLGECKACGKVFKYLRDDGILVSESVSNEPDKPAPKAKAPAESNDDADDDRITFDTIHLRCRCCDQGLTAKRSWFALAGSCETIVCNRCETPHHVRMYWTKDDRELFAFDTNFGSAADPSGPEFHAEVIGEYPERKLPKIPKLTSLKESMAGKGKGRLRKAVDQQKRRRERREHRENMEDRLITLAEKSIAAWIEGQQPNPLSPAIYERLAHLENRLADLEPNTREEVDGDGDGSPCDECDELPVCAPKKRVCERFAAWLRKGNEGGAAANMEGLSPMARCPHCGAGIAVPAYGAAVQCTNCERDFVATIPSDTVVEHTDPLPETDAALRKALAAMSTLASARLDELRKLETENTTLRDQLTVEKSLTEKLRVHLNEVIDKRDGLRAMLHAAEARSQSYLTALADDVEGRKLAEAIVVPHHCNAAEVLDGLADAADARYEEAVADKTIKRKYTMQGAAAAYDAAVQTVREHCAVHGTLVDDATPLRSGADLKLVLQQREHIVELERALTAAEAESPEQYVDGRSVKWWSMLAKSYEEEREQAVALRCAVDAAEVMYCAACGVVLLGIPEQVSKTCPACSVEGRWQGASSVIVADAIMDGSWKPERPRGFPPVVTSTCFPADIELWKPHHYTAFDALAEGIGKLDALFDEDDEDDDDVAIRVSFPARFQSWTPAMVRSAIGMLRDVLDLGDTGERLYWCGECHSVYLSDGEQVCATCQGGPSTSEVRGLSFWSHTVPGAGTVFPPANAVGNVGVCEPESPKPTIQSRAECATCTGSLSRLFAVPHGCARSEGALICINYVAVKDEGVPAVIGAKGECDVQQEAEMRVEAKRVAFPCGHCGQQTVINRRQTPGANKTKCPQCGELTTLKCTRQGRGFGGSAYGVDCEPRLAYHCSKGEGWLLIGYWRLPEPDDKPGVPT